MRTHACSQLTLSLCAAIALFAAASFANVTLPAIISDNMVVQSGEPLVIWGWADPGENVAVALSGKVARTAADKDGNWAVKLEPLKAGAIVELTINGKNVLKVKNILAGELWICSGQSNMAWGVAKSNNSAEEIAQANYPQIRMFTLPNVTAETPAKDTPGRWLICTPETVSNWSAVGYFFARELHKTLKTPVGMINSSWGATAAEMWTSRETLLAKPELKTLIDNPPPVYAGTPSQPSTIYNAMIAPLARYRIKGAIWYQGESNAARAAQYRTLLPAMIADWRKAWGYDFDFNIVQLANYMPRMPEPRESNWAELREAQALTAASVPRCGLAVAIDIGDAADIHPRNKQEVGRRLALVALAKTYAQKLAYAGPEFEKIEIQADKAWLKFKNTGGGLEAKDGELKGFAIAGADKKFFWAQAKIEGKAIVVWSDKVKQPVAVRYAWAENPDCNLYNKEGLPAVPFRTDEPAPPPGK